MGKMLQKYKTSASRIEVIASFRVKIKSLNDGLRSVKVHAIMINFDL